jgi:sortase (surface protein transpeptidase)
VAADDLSLLKHEERDWLTLFTCRDYDERAEAYRWRLAVRAVLTRVEELE